MLKSLTMLIMVILSSEISLVGCASRPVSTPFSAFDATPTFKDGLACYTEQDLFKLTMILDQCEHSGQSR